METSDSMQKDKCVSCHDCCHGRHGMMGGFSWLRILIALVILGFIFSAGVKFGELKSGFYGYGMMGGGERGFFMKRASAPNGQNMMWNYQFGRQLQNTTSTPAK